MKKIKTKYIVLLIVFVALLVTNPNRATFTEYLSAQNEIMMNPAKDFYGRKMNFLIFSIYSYNEAFHEITNHTITYEEHFFLGMLGNFIKVGKKQKRTGYAWE